jgi:hypothetical protein
MQLLEEWEEFDQTLIAIECVHRVCNYVLVLVSF